MVMAVSLRWPFIEGFWPQNKTSVIGSGEKTFPWPAPTPEKPSIDLSSSLKVVKVQLEPKRLWDKSAPGYKCVLNSSQVGNWLIETVSWHFQ